MLNIHHPKLEINTATLPAHGAKTLERLRGNSRVLEYSNTAATFEKWAEQWNNYHRAEIKVEDDDIKEQQLEESQLYQSTRMAEWDNAEYSQHGPPSANRH